MDLVGLSSYLTNGFSIRNSTCIEGIRILKNACYYVDLLSDPEPQPYWRYEPGLNTQYFQGESQAQEDLWRLMCSAVDHYTRGKRVLLALSGGYDSSAILGILKTLDHPSVTCFSYSNGIPIPGSDAAVAQQQASWAGYPLIILNSFSSQDAVAFIRKNAANGNIHRGPSGEIDAYEQLLKTIPPDENQVFLFGEECFGWNTFKLNTQYDLLGATFM